MYMKFLYVGMYYAKYTTKGTSIVPLEGVNNYQS